MSSSSRLFGAFLVALTTGLCLAVAARAQAPADAVRKAVASVVTISGEDASGSPTASGSGFFVAEDLIATDYLLIKDAIKIRVNIAGQETMEARLAGVDSQRTVALLRVPGAKGARLYYACPSLPSVGDTVYVIGSASSSDGVLKVTITKTPEVSGRRYFQLNGALSAASSGSPVLDKSGEVFGVAIRSTPQATAPDMVIHLRNLASIYNGGYRCDPQVIINRIREDRLSLEDSAGGGVIGGVPEGARPPAIAGEPTPRIIRKSGGVLQGGALRHATPLYPPLAKAARVSGAVVVEVVVDEEGHVIAARALFGHPLLKDSAVAAARGWRWSQTTLEGVPVKVVGTITFNFTP